MRCPSRPTEHIELRRRMTFVQILERDDRQPAESIFPNAFTVSRERSDLAIAVLRKVVMRDFADLAGSENNKRFFHTKCRQMYLAININGIFPKRIIMTYDDFSAQLGNAEIEDCLRVFVEQVIVPVIHIAAHQVECDALWNG